MNAATVAGWMAAVAVAGMALVTWRALGARMEDVARASHELRGPITAARLGLELGSRAGELSAARLRAIDLELGRASLALEDLDRVRERRRAAGSVAPVDLEQLLADSVEAWRPAAAAAGKALGLRWTGGGATVSADRRRLAQAVGNLIANALGHGGAEVRVMRLGQPHRRTDRGQRRRRRAPGPAGRADPAPASRTRGPRPGAGDRGRHRRRPRRATDGDGSRARHSARARAPAARPASSGRGAASILSWTHLTATMAVCSSLLGRPEVCIVCV